MKLLCIQTLAETHISDVTLQYQEKAIQSGIPTWVFVAVGVFAIAIAMGMYIWVNRYPAIQHTPIGVMHELCRSHRINRKGRILLATIAEEASLDQPAILFTAQEQFDNAIDAVEKKMRFSNDQRSTMGVLRRKMFA